MPVRNAISPYKSPGPSDSTEISPRPSRLKTALAWPLTMNRTLSPGSSEDIIKSPGPYVTWRPFSLNRDRRSKGTFSQGSIPGPPTRGIFSISQVPVQREITDRRQRQSSNLQCDPPSREITTSLRPRNDRFPRCHCEEQMATSQLRAKRGNSNVKAISSLQGR